MNIFPKKILFATDLSAECDRAQERAVMLSKIHDTELVVLHVIETSARFHVARRQLFSHSFNPDQAQFEQVSRLLMENLSSAAGRFSIRIKKGPVADSIIKTAREENCDFIITGAARKTTAGGTGFGTNTGRLIGKTTVPLLLISSKAIAPYRNIIIASDFSNASRMALRTAVALFPDKRLVLFNTHSAPGSYAVDNQNSYREEMRLIAHKEYISFINSSGLPENYSDYISPVIEWGSPVLLLQEYISHASADLVILGSRRRNMFAAFLLGSKAKRIASEISCDVLIVPESPEAEVILAEPGIQNPENKNIQNLQ